MGWQLAKPCTNCPFEMAGTIDAKEDNMDTTDLISLAAQLTQESQRLFPNEMRNGKAINATAYLLDEAALALRRASQDAKNG